MIRYRDPYGYPIIESFVFPEVLVFGEVIDEEMEMCMSCPRGLMLVAKCLQE